MNNRLKIMVIEDDDVAAESIERSLKKHGITSPILHVENGAMALDLLRQIGVGRSHGVPVIVLLDLNMPRMNGFEFLREVRSDPDLSSLVVFVLTTSDAEMDRARAYQEHVAGYMVKSAVGPQFRRLASLLEQYAQAVVLP
jgi:CheY-like chemotaxis protein